MSSEQPTSPRDFENSSRYIPQVLQKKMNAQTDWAELTRQQQYYAEQMIQQEKDRKLQQKAELNEALSSLVQEKEAKKKFNTFNEKQDDYTHSAVRKQEYDNYLEKLKNDKQGNQKGLASDYSKNMWLKEEEKRKKMAEEKRAEERILSDALDSLQKEKAIKEKQRREFISSIEPLMQEKEAQKRREQEKLQQDREEHRRLMDERAKNLELQESNYKLYYQRINENQSARQQVWDQNIGQSARFKDRNIDSFVEKGVEEARRKAEQEEILRQQKKQEQLRNMKESIQSKIQEHDNLRMKEKLSYQEKVEELMRQNQQAYNHKEQLKKDRINNTTDYKTILEIQMREAEEQKRKSNSDMLEHEKKMHNNFDGLIPGIRSSKLDPYSAHTKSARNLSTLSPDVSSPYSGSPYGISPLMNSPYTSRDNRPDGVPSIQSIKTSTNSVNPFNTNKQDNYNPITNPIPNNMQNPYLGREFQRSGYQSKGVLASVANKNLLG